MINFALSYIANPYLEKIIEKYPERRIDMRSFKEFMEQQKERVTSIKRLRELLMIKVKEDKVILGYKIVFKEISLVFIKYFSVNWIYNSKIEGRMIHLKYRFKMIRRVENPKMFTHIEDINRKRKC